MAVARLSILRRSIPPGWAAVVVLVFSAAIAAQLLGRDTAIAFAITLFAAGIAHGAGDEQGSNISRYSLAQGFAYLLAGLAIAAVFVAWPLAGLTVFLLISAWHFARSGPGAAAYRAGFAFTAIGGSALWNLTETAEAFRLVLGAEPPRAWMLTLAMLGAAGLVLASIALAHDRRWSLQNGVLLASLAAMALFHPILAVGLAFILGHALPVQREQLRRYGIKQALIAQAPATGLAVIAILAIIVLVIMGWLSVPIAAALAFGMAPPHMLAERLDR